MPTKEKKNDVIGNKLITKKKSSKYQGYFRNSVSVVQSIKMTLRVRWSYHLYINKIKIIKTVVSTLKRRRGGRRSSSEFHGSFSLILSFPSKSIRFPIPIALEKKFLPS